MKLTRRDFVRSGTAALAALMMPPTLLGGRAAAAAGYEPVLVTVFLRGGADFLHLVAPYRDPDYHAARRTLALGSGDVHDLDGFFGLNPALGDLLPFWRSGQLAVVHACGSPDPSKSHFEAQDFMETAAPGDKTVDTGWLNRYVAAARLRDPWSSVTIGMKTARSLAGAAPTVALRSTGSFFVVGTRSDERRAAIEKMARLQGGAYQRAAENANRALEVLRSVRVDPRVSYPSSRTASTMREVAALIRAQIGVRVVTVDMNGWDTHDAAWARLDTAGQELAGALAAFARDLGSDFDRTVVLVMSEFGRRVAENEASGTEHGRGGAMLVLGGRIRGGRVILRGGRWPGLARENLEGGLDLAVTTDFRNVMAEVLHRHMKLTQLAPVFPGFAISPLNFPGILG